MFIAFEGPDNVGKSTSAQALDCAGQPDYQVTKAMHEKNIAEWNGDASSDPMPHTYDRISWLSHMVYRLALPGREWHDEAVRTVFAMPDTHLVFKLHRPDTADFNETRPDSRTGLVIETSIARVNPVYWWAADALMRLNQFQDYDLFKSVSIIEVVNTSEGYSQQLVSHDNPSWEGYGADILARMVTTDSDLMHFLHDVDARIG
jgi:hypothetical protein